MKYNPDTTAVSESDTGGDERSYLVTSLESASLYYFAAQVKNDGLWSSITVASSTCFQDTLAPVDTQKIANTINIAGINSIPPLMCLATVDCDCEHLKWDQELSMQRYCFSVINTLKMATRHGDTILESINFNGENVY